MHFLEKPGNAIIFWFGTHQFHTRRDRTALTNENKKNPSGKDSKSDALILDSLKTSGLRETHASEWVRAFTRFHQIPVFRRVWLYLAFMTVYTILIDRFMDKALISTLAKQSGAVAFSSIVLGVLLVFRTETAYECWLEGRKLWGQLLNDSRSFCFKLKSLSGVPELEKMKMGQYIISFAYALKHQLRDTTPSEPLPGLERGAHLASNLPMHIAEKIFQLAFQWVKDSYIDDRTLEHLLENLKTLTDTSGSCERIKTSQMAVSYRAFMRQGIVLNLAVCPWLLAGEYSLLLCIPVILIGTYFLVGLELIAGEIEEPFGKDLDDLPLDTLCGTIRTSVTEILGLHKALKYTQTAEGPIPDLLST